MEHTVVLITLPKELKEPIEDILSKIDTNRLKTFKKRIANNPEISARPEIAYAFSTKGEKVYDLSIRLLYYIAHIQTDAFAREKRPLSEEDKKELSVISYCSGWAKSSLEGSAPSDNDLIKQDEKACWVRILCELSGANNANNSILGPWNRLYDKLFFWRKPWYKP